MTRLQLILVSLLFSNYCFAQQNPKIKFGTLDTTVVSVEEFNNQKELIIQKGYKIDTAIAFFSGANFSNISSVNFYPTYDSLSFSKLRSSIIPGSVVTFDVRWRKINLTKSQKSSLSFVFYSMKRNDSFFIKTPQQIELKRFRDLKYIKGTIYFSGANFNNVAIFSINPTNLERLKELFDRTGPGSSITFENVYYQTEASKTDRLNMTIKFE